MGQAGFVRAVVRGFFTMFGGLERQPTNKQIDYWKSESFFRDASKKASWTFTVVPTLDVLVKRASTDAGMGQAAFVRAVVRGFLRMSGGLTQRATPEDIARWLQEEKADDAGDAEIQRYQDEQRGK